MTEKAVSVDWKAWNKAQKEELEKTPHCHFTPMEWVEDYDGDGHFLKSSSGWLCNHCGHTKSCNWKPKDRAAS